MGAVTSALMGVDEQVNECVRVNKTFTNTTYRDIEIYNAYGHLFWARFALGSTNTKLMIYERVRQLYRGKNRILVVVGVGDARDSPACNLIQARCATSKDARRYKCNV